MKHPLLAALLLTGPAWAQTPATFAPVVIYSTGAGSQAQALAAADVNGDGTIDLLTANSFANNVGVLLGTGTGTFGTVTTYSTGTNSRPYGIAVADVNGDGHPDLLTANGNTQTAGVLLGTGTGTFAPVVTYSAGAYGQPYSIAAADVNGDGHLDLLTANYSTNVVGVLLGTGTGTFGAVTNYNTGAGTGPSGIAVADVNSDGILDLVTSNQDNSTVGVMLGTGTGSFPTVVTYSIGAASFPASVAVADVSGDGKPDLLTTNFIHGGVAVLLGTGMGAFAPAVTYSTGSGSQPYTIAVADVNGDSKLDLVTANNGTNVAGVMLGTGTGTFGAMTSYSTGASSGPVGMAVADVNGDHRPDLLTTNVYNNAAGVLLNTTAGFLPTRAALSGASAALAPNPATTSATLTATGLPVDTRSLEVSLLSLTGQVVRRLTVPATLGTVQANVPTVGLAPGLYLVHLHALNTQGIDLGTLPMQRLSIAE